MDESPGRPRDRVNVRCYKKFHPPKKTLPKAVSPAKLGQRIWPAGPKQSHTFAMNSQLPAHLIAHINVKLALIGCSPVPLKGDREFVEIARKRPAARLASLSR
jgi:hypothetical protein